MGWVEGKRGHGRSKKGRGIAREKSGAKPIDNFLTQSRVKERKEGLDSFSILRYLFITCIHDLLINYLILDILQVYYIINIPYILFGSFS